MKMGTARLQQRTLSWTSRIDSGQPRQSNKTVPFSRIVYKREFTTELH